MHIILFLIALALLNLIHRSSAEACSGIVVGRAASETGFVILGHNEDDPGRAVVQHYLMQPEKHREDSKIVMEEGAAQIPQISRTAGFFWSQARSIPGKSCADFFFNEHGVAVASDSCRASRRDNEADISRGGVEYGIRRIVAERATSARHGVTIAAEITGTYGYRNSGRCYIIADRDEAWMIQLVHGKHYCARRIRDDEVAFIPNHYTIHRVAPLDEENFLLSPGLIEYAIEKGWYVPARKGSYEDFDFARAFQDVESWEKEGNTLRQRHALSILTGRKWSDDEELPFAVSPSRKIGMVDVKRVLRAHYEGSEDDIRGDLGDTSPHFTDNRRICTGTTLESCIVQFREDRDNSLLWLTAGRPCTAPYVPWYAGTSPFSECPSGREAENAMEKHFHLSPESMAYDGNAAWWAIQDLLNIADLQYERTREVIEKRISSAERRWAAEESENLSEVLNSPERGTALRTDFTSRHVGEAVKLARALFEEIPQMKISIDSEEIRMGDISSELDVTFETPGGETPNAEALRFGQGMRKPQEWARAIGDSLKRTDDGRWTVRFRTRELTDSCVPCYSDFWLGGCTSSGEPFAGRCFLNVLPRKDAARK